MSFQRIANTGHRLTNGYLVKGGFSTDMAAYIEVEYAFTDRLSVSAGLPYVFSKYTDAISPPPPIPYLPIDQCHCWQTAWQDLGITARYNLVRRAGGAFSLTPSLAVGLPTNDYEFRGEAAAGRNLREIRMAIDVGQRVDLISPRLVVQGRYSYAFVEKVIDISTDRSTGALEVDYQLTKKLLARGLLLLQRTHGGLRFGSPPPATLVIPGEINTPETLYQHDRLLRDNNWRAGTGLTYSFTKFDVFASYIEYMGGTDTHAGRAVTFGLSWPFELGRHGSYKKP